ncbi:S1 RNA-binding domain-containing protein [Ascidiimonas sp. W6]|uniref:CvfB family protein n=1 Tax=Ascidiimonas meishanensis TaxID=3128903 RepID=UPI0030EB37D9
MIEIGQYNTLEILRDTDPGLFLGDDEDNDVLLPNKYVPKDFEIGSKITVFCYLDHMERLVATTLKPAVMKNSFALLKAIEVNEIGAFMDWGLEKHLFVPFREQAARMIAGKWYLIYCYVDEKTNRLVGSSKTDRFIDNDSLSIEKYEEVEIIVSRHTDLGAEVIINNKHKGLIYKDELFEPVHLGQRLKGIVKKIREDNKVDITLRQIGYKNIEPNSQRILEALKMSDGFIALHDKSDPNEIRRHLKMSKKDFKKAIGSLYKERLIDILPDGIRVLI